MKSEFYEYETLYIQSLCYYDQRLNHENKFLCFLNAIDSYSDVHDEQVYYPVAAAVVVVA